MPRPSRRLSVALLAGWPSSVKSAMLHVISLAQFAAAYSRGWAANSINARVRLKAENDRLQQEVQLLREQMRIKDARMESIPPHHRPFYPPPHRMAILELKAARGWSLEQAAWEFLVTAATIASWLRRIDEDGPNALVQLRQSAGLTPPPTRLSKVAGPGQCSGSVPPRLCYSVCPWDSCGQCELLLHNSRPRASYITTI